MKSADISDPSFEYDDGDPDGFRSGMFRMGTKFGAQKTGASVYEIPPGQALCPYHYEYGEEEWVLVIQGTATIRTPDGKQTAGPNTVAFFPAGPDGAHQIRNDADEPLRVLMWSSIVHPCATVYPDSDKIGIWTGGDRSDDLIVRRSSGVDYFEGES